MDPNTTLAAIRVLVSRMQGDYDSETSNGIDQDDANELAELVDGLDRWIAKGGFVPHLWNKKGIGWPPAYAMDDACKMLAKLIEQTDVDALELHVRRDGRIEFRGLKGVCTPYWFHANINSETQKPSNEFMKRGIKP